jgi:predicted site-specific integrase-resolvase
MKTQETKLKFIEMRARGLSFDKISAELEVAASTLYRWEGAMSAEIDARMRAERERIIAEFNLAENERLQRYCALYQRVSAQVDKDYLQIVPTHHLLRMMMTLDKKISKAVERPPSLADREEDVTGEQKD